MLIKEVAQNYGGRVEFKSENWGDSKLAERYGVKKYPVVFVDDILLAQPNDFGWYGAKGKYTPWRERASHEKFKRDLTRMIELVLAGRKELAAQGAAQTKVEEEEIARLPDFSVQDTAGRALDAKSLAGRVVVVEFWATWCPPCRSTLLWLAELKKRYGARLVVIAIAVESEEKEVRELTKDSPLSVVMGSEALVAPFGTLGSVPRMFLFDATGKTAGVFYGAPADLHEKVARLIDSLLQPGAKKESAESVFRAAQEAMGGERALKGVRSIRAVADCLGPKGKYRTEILSASPDRLFFKQTWETRPPFLAFVNGARAWLKDERTGGVSGLDKGSVAAVRGHEFQMIAIAPAERFKEAGVEGFEDFAGARSIKMRAVDESGNPLYLFFNAQTHLMSGMILNDASSATGATVRVVFNEWRRVDGLLLPSKVTATDKSGDFVFDFREITLNQPEGDTFRVPQEIAAQQD